MGTVKSATELRVYQLAYSLAMEIFETSKFFPVEERFALTSQVRRSSRSICLNLREAWAKRRYEAHFIAKLTDCDGEANETDTAIDFAHDCGYIDQATHQRLKYQCSQIGAMLGTMVNQAHRFTPS